MNNLYGDIGDLGLRKELASPWSMDAWGGAVLQAPCNIPLYTGSINGIAHAKTLLNRELKKSAGMNSRERVEAIVNNCGECTDHKCVVYALTQKIKTKREQAEAVAAI